MSMSGFGSDKESGAGAASSDVRQMVVFQLGEGVYGLDIQYVLEINRISEFTPIPNAPSYVKGIINLRGTIVPVVNLGQRFGLDERDTPIFINNRCSYGDLSLGNGVQVGNSAGGTHLAA